MKTKLLFLLFAVLFLANNSYCQFSFGVSPGIGLNSAYFGYKINSKIVPYIGFQYINAKFKYEESGEKYDWETNQVVSYSIEDRFSGSLYIPNIGVKYFLKQQNKIKAYLSLNISKPLLSGNIKCDGEEDKEFNENIKKVRMWGCELGFGIEYFFDDNFSVGGEFGLRYLHLKYNDSYMSDIYNPDTGNYQDTEIEHDYRFKLSPTFSRISFNFYFGSSE